MSIPHLPGLLGWTLLRLTLLIDVFGYLMRKDFIFYIPAFILLLTTVFFFDQAHRDILHAPEGIQVGEAIRPLERWIVIFVILTVAIMGYGVANLYIRGKQKEQELNVANQSLKNAQRIGHVGNWSYDTGTGYIFMSDEVYHIIGLSKTDFTPTLMSMKQLIYSDDLASVEDIINRFTSASLEFDLSHRIQLHSGQVKWLQHNVRSVIGKRGNFIFEGTLSDITKDKESEKQVVDRVIQLVVEKNQEMAFHARVEKDIRSSNKRLRELTRHLQSIREEERTRIAREIHDELGQQLTGLKIDASWIRNRIDANEAAIHNKLQGMISLIDDTVKTVQRIASDLRPGILDDLGLIPAIEWQCQDFERRTGITSACNIEAFDFSLEKDLATGIFRVYQEALTNVARHSIATKVETVLLSANGFIELNIKDNGIGFDVEESGTKKSWGLVGMKERALMFNGELLISSVPGMGTRLTLKVPIPTNHLS